MTKRKLSKLLNKKLQYTAILGELDTDKGRVLITDVRHEGKVYADHLWVFKSQDLNNIEVGSKILFFATAYMYNDKFKIRKQGLDNCRSYYTIYDDYHLQIIKEAKDAKHKRIRKQK